MRGGFKEKIKAFFTEITLREWLIVLAAFLVLIGIFVGLFLYGISIRDDKSPDVVLPSIAESVTPSPSPTLSEEEQLIEDEQAELVASIDEYWAMKAEFEKGLPASTETDPLWEGKYLTYLAGDYGHNKFRQVQSYIYDEPKMHRVGDSKLFNFTFENFSLARTGYSDNEHQAVVRACFDSADSGLVFNETGEQVYATGQNGEQLILNLDQLSYGRYPVKITAAKRVVFEGESQEDGLVYDQWQIYNIKRDDERSVC